MFHLIVRKPVQETIASAKKLKTEKTVKNDLDDSDEDDEEVIKMKGKRKIACLVDSDSDSEYVNDENESDNSQDGSKFSRKQPTAAKKKIKLEPSKKITIEEKLKANKDESQSPMDIDESSIDADIGDGPVVYKHHKIDWIKPDKIRDAQKRRPDDPKYDPTTVYIPDGFLDEQTPVSILYSIRFYKSVAF